MALLARGECEVKLRGRIWWVMGLAALTALAAAAQDAGTDAFLNSMDLNFAQYGERMGLSLWAFNQSVAARGMGSSAAVRAKGRARIKAGKASVRYRPLAATLANEFAAARGGDAARRREVARTYNLFLERFRDAQRGDGLGERDVAAALGLAFASQYEIYSEGKRTTPAQDRDVVRQFREALLKDAYFQGTTDHYRQSLDENTAVQTVAGLVGYRNAAKRGDRPAIEKEREQALAFLDFYWPGDAARAKKIRLTPAGFRDESGR